MQNGALYEAAFPQISEFWMRQGVGYLAKQFADVKENKDDFRNTIESFGDASMLSLFGVYYYDFVNDSGTIQQAQQIAASVLLYVKETYGREELLKWLCGQGDMTTQEIYEEWRSGDWLRSLVSESEYPLVEGVQYGCSDSYDIILYMGEYDYMIVIL